MVSISILGCTAEKCLTRVRINKSKRQGTLGFLHVSISKKLTPNSSVEGHDAVGCESKEEARLKECCDSKAKEISELESEAATREGKKIIQFRTMIVGRRFQEEYALKSREKCIMFAEKDNPFDPNSVLVKTNDTDGRILGHLPRLVAAKLSTLLNMSSIEIEGIVLEDVEDKRNAPILLQIKADTLSQIDFDFDGIQNMIETHRSSVKEFSATSKLLGHVDNIMQEVCTIESNALGADDVRFVEQYRLLSAAAKGVFLRLSQKSKDSFRLAKFVMDDVFDIEKGIHDLLEAGLLEHVNIMTENFNSQKMKSLVFDLLSVNELSSILNEAQKAYPHEISLAMLSTKGKKALRREDYLTVISTCVNSSSRKFLDWLTRRISQITGEVARFPEAVIESFRRIQRLFFLNENHSLSHWAAVDSGSMQYPVYPITRSCPVFQNQNHLREYENALNQAVVLVQAIEVRLFSSASFCILLGKSKTNSFW